VGVGVTGAVVDVGGVVVDDDVPAGVEVRGTAADGIPEDVRTPR
jgi:hypothetical protein